MAGNASDGILPRRETGSGRNTDADGNLNQKGLLRSFKKSQQSSCCLQVTGPGAGPLR